MASAVHVFGIRHHGPGSARALVAALDALRPAAVLIEGPADASDLLPMLADPKMVPPVALLAYAADDPSVAIFWPFAAFSPEYQAALWAHRHGAAMRFIDLPASWRLGAIGPDAPPPADEAAVPAVVRDPIGALAAAAGYEDGESWWRDVIEENPAPGPVFAAVADAMTALRDTGPTPVGREAAREAHMRREIAAVAKDADGPIAVVCGAWHAPALAAATLSAAAGDQALLAGAPKRKIVATWAPWTAPRLAMASGYGAGVVAPGWCAHLWQTDAADIVPRFLARTAAALRRDGHLVSTAGIIDAQRLARGLAAIRLRPAPGFEELRDAAIACFCDGERARWETVARTLLVGSEVGHIPDGVPLAPLLLDLQREQKRLRLPPEAADRELALDLRSDSGLDRSVLLHRLVILDVPWGREADAGGSRGTFRERWVLRWEPEFAVRLVENLVFGATIAQAADGRLRAEFGKAASLAAIAERVLDALTAQLASAVDAGIGLLEKRAARTDDCPELLAALPPLAGVVRYGEARRTDAAQLGALLRRIVVQAALGLPYACRGLDDDAASAMRVAIIAADEAVALAALDDDARAAWRQGLQALVDNAQTAALVAGAAARLLHQADALAPGEAADLLGRMLSPGRPVADAAAFFDGFFGGSGERLIDDDGLRLAVDRWLAALDADAFVLHLPLFRRTFADLDRTQRRRLLDAVSGAGPRGLPGFAPAPGADSLWPQHFARLAAILTAKPQERPDDE
ncbi:MAG: hypothetical protein JNL66_00385 [Alphaproteobacteria bacterium]|nr:hypothetical protein [Alphaproteobacteria bacterium]